MAHPREFDGGAKGIYSPAHARLLLSLGTRRCPDAWRARGYSHHIHLTFIEDRSSAARDSARAARRRAGWGVQGKGKGKGKGKGAGVWEWMGGIHPWEAPGEAPKNGPLMGVVAPTATEAPTA